MKALKQLNEEIETLKAYRENIEETGLYISTVSGVLERRIGELRRRRMELEKYEKENSEVEK